jgi:hypothetical protein
MRGDDYTFQLHGHHLVIYNCGMVRKTPFGSFLSVYPEPALVNQRFL